MKIDLDLRNLLSARTIIAATETDDEIGCVLRLHLQVEQLLVVFLSMKLKAPVTEYVQEPREFSRKLAFAVAFGFPLPFAAVAKQVNKIRNELAHRDGTSLDERQVKLLGQLVDKLSSMDSKFEPMAKRRMELTEKAPGEVISFGTGNLRADFVLSVLAFLTAAVPHVIRHTAQEQKANEPSYAPRYPAQR
ncbi:hypothetical protein QYH69_32270 [Paraburkholderia sp. SARCC-3016]|uniref:hypothetical protein n=1 Tax=Paraburkholderia sp. SARCC-3016 TaxID=3058611 RepID=UPI002808BA25|nr:hypothetical protein [Paraburkholderia sp. SARCC-3016]MDQ7981900.1 hypothetical protein [Paraburkholderia sp. SARCC-3016]